MEQQNQIKELVRKITNDNFPNEEILIDTYADDQIELMMNGDSIDERELKAHYEFTLDPGTILSFISTIAATVKTFMEIKKLLKPGSKHGVNEVASKWKEHLIANGLSEDISTKIVASFQQDLQKIIIESK